MEGAGTLSQDLILFSLLGKNHFLTTSIFNTEFGNVGFQDFLAIYFKMVKWGDGLLCVSKAYVGAWLLGLVGSSYSMVIPTRYPSKVQYSSIQPVLLKEVRMSEAKFIRIFNAVRSIHRSRFVFR